MTSPPCSAPTATSTTSPTHRVYVNQGDGRFEGAVITRGIPTHETKAVDVEGDRTIDVVKKSYGPTHLVDLWRNAVSQRSDEQEPAGVEAGQSAPSSR